MSDSKQPIRITLAEDHPIVLLALRSQLDPLPWVDIVAVCEDSIGLIRSLESEPSDLVITDLSMNRDDETHDGLKLLRFLALRFPSVRVLVLSGLANAGVIRCAMKAGARGFISKLDPVSELLQAIAHVRNQPETFYSTTAAILLKTHARAPA